MILFEFSNTSDSPHGLVAILELGCVRPLRNRMELLLGGIKLSNGVCRV
jgi:hypothetical protein